MRSIRRLVTGGAAATAATAALLTAQVLPAAANPTIGWGMQAGPATKIPDKDNRAYIAAAEKEGFKLAPFIGIACPGVIREDGSIEKGAQNLPGNWESSKFNLPASLIEAIPTIGDHDTAVLMHNDAVVQGLSEAPYMQDVARWGVLTIGTGLGNARFTNRRRDNGKTGNGGKESRKDKD